MQASMYHCFVNAALADMVDHGTGQCHDFSGLEPSQKGNNQCSIAKGTTELLVQSTLWAVAVNDFTMESAHCELGAQVA